MTDWKPDLYLQFGKERTQPAIDLVSRIDHDGPKRILDVGCGPGNSTNVLKSRWPQAEIIGLDNSQAMIEEAKSNYPAMDWMSADASGDLTGLGKFDIVFSNAAIQWIPDQEKLLSKLYGMLNKGGILAVQVPYTNGLPTQSELVKLISCEKWKNYYTDFMEGYTIYSPDFYFDTLSRLTKDIDIWETKYIYIMNSHADIVKFYSGSALRDYLDRLKNETQTADFLSDYENALKPVYAARPDGRVLFPFTRIFFIARKGTAL